MSLLAVVVLLALAPPAPRPVISFWNGIGDAQVFIMAADGRGVRQLTHLFSAKRASWSPDGKQLVFDGRFYKTVNDFDIGIMRADGSGVRRITRGPERDVMAVWSPDGRWLAFSRLRAEGAEPDVWLVRPTVGGSRSVACVPRVPSQRSGSCVRTGARRTGSSKDPLPPGRLTLAGSPSMHPAGSTRFVRTEADDA